MENQRKKKEISGLGLTNKASWVGLEMIFSVLDSEPGLSVPDSIDKLNVILQNNQSASL